ncbi:unnamed protein product [Diamesa tonsa]
MEQNFEEVSIYVPAAVKFTDPTLTKREKKFKLKLEKEKQKIEHEKQLTRDELNRELKNKTLSFARGSKDWERWCEQITHHRLKTDVQVTAKALNRLIDKSDLAIETMKMHRETADEQYVRNFNQHCDIIDYIMRIYDLFLKSTHEMYDSSRDKLICDFYNESVFREKILHDRKTFYENELIVKLEAKLNTTTYNHLSVLTNFKSEFNFMNKLHRTAEAKTKKEELMDKNSIGTLVTIADKIKKNLHVSIERGKFIQAASKVCKKYERISDGLIIDERIYDEDNNDDLMNKFHMKVAKVEHHNIGLRKLKQHLSEQNEILQQKLKEFDHNQKVQRNIWMLQISNAPLVGSASQISHHIPQIQNRIKARKSSKHKQFMF